MAVQVGRSQISAEAPIPRTCLKDITPTTGRPFMLPHKGSVNFGLSSRPSPLRDKAPLVVWVSNSTNRLQSVATCSDLEHLLTDAIDVVNADGTRIPSSIEREEQSEPGAMNRIRFRTGICLRNITIRIPPKSCVHGDFEKPTYDFVKKLGDYYPLGVGHYMITPRSSRNREKISRYGLVVEVRP
jgi:hypothetical protein